MNKLDLAIELAKNFDENFEENEEDENGLCSSAFNNKKTFMSFDQAYEYYKKGKKINVSKIDEEIFLEGKFWEMNDIFKLRWEVVE